MANNKGSFWTTIPGILTGISAIIAAVGGIIVAFISPSPKLENSNTDEHDKYIFISYGVDDAMSCTLNGSPIASQKFGSGEVRLDVTDLVKSGQKNRLYCRVLDNNNGSCYAWDFELQKNGTEALVKQKFSCCNNSCSKSGDIVLDESFDFQT
jgi:hypothetical protein